MNRLRKIRVIVVHGVRVCIVAALLMLIPQPRSRFAEPTESLKPPNLESIQRLLPDASAVASDRDANGCWAVKNSDDAVIAYVARTLPESADVIGYRGPTEAMILLDEKFNLLGVDLIDSADTEEHVVAVRSDAQFFQQFGRWKWGGLDTGAKVDAVSGATLTSLALAKGVLRRIGGDRPSLVFPDPVTPADLTRWYPETVTAKRQGDLVSAIDQSGRVIGLALRSGPLSDSIVGYQGPTELLIRIEASGADGDMNADQTSSRPVITVADITIRSSFDNQPYVRYCKTEASFWNRFEGKTITALAAMDLAAEGVEGVSGATMTSMAIAETLVATAVELETRLAERSDSNDGARSLWSRIRRWFSGAAGARLTRADFGCVVILGLIPLSRSRGWFRQRRVRKLWLATVVVVIGMWSGNLISMALIAGWSAGGIAWQLAPALSAILVVALVCPVVAKSNPYCNHICPHGAIQQLVRPMQTSRRHWRLPRRVFAVMKYLPGSLLVTAYLTLLWIPSADLSSWEPFHAYLFRIAPWTTMLLAALTIVLSAFVPMGYCRLGCPTGRLLDHLRRSASSDRIQVADGVAIGLLILAVLSR